MKAGGRNLKIEPNRANSWQRPCFLDHAQLTGWYGMVSGVNIRSQKLGLYFCVNFLTSSELIGYIDLTDYYDIWPKCSLVINAKKGVRLFWYSKYFSFWTLSGAEDRQIFDSQIFNLPTSKWIFSSTNRSIIKASHPFVVHQLLIDIVQFRRTCDQEGR